MKKTRSLVLFLIVSLVTVFTISCKKTSDATTVAAPTLYDSLGVLPLCRILHMRM